MVAVHPGFLFKCYRLFDYPRTVVNIPLPKWHDLLIYMSCGDSQEVTQCHQERKQTQLRCPDDSQHAIPLGPPCTASPEATIELSRNLSAGQCSSVASTMLTSCLVCHHAPRPILNAKRQCHACTSHSIPKRVFALLLIASLSADDVQGNAMDSP